MATSMIADDFLGSSTALTITLASLANSTVGVGQQSTIVTNTVSGLSAGLGYPLVIIYYKITLGSSPTANTSVRFALIRGDGGSNYDYGAGATNASLTIFPEPVPIWVAPTGSSPTTGQVLQGSFKIYNPGPAFGIWVVNGSGVSLNSTAGNHFINWVGILPQAQAS